MKRKCAWLLVLVLLASMLMSSLVYATGEDDAAGRTEISEETETETLPVEPAEDPRKTLKEAMEKNPLDANEVIADGVYIDDLNVSGMTAEEAMETVIAYVEELGNKTLTLTLDGADDVEPITVRISELGLRTNGLSEIIMEAVALGKSGNLIVRYKAKKDLEISNQKYELPLAVEENAVKNFVSTETSHLSVEPVNAELTRVSGGFSVSQSKTGIEVNTGTTVTSIMTALKDWNKEDITVAAAAQVKQPERTTEMLSQIQDKIGTFSTTTGSASEGKLQNLRTGVKLTDGAIIMPGESWSMHDALAPFNAENGYTTQIAYMNGGYVQEYGGGICQLATTLYNAALLAEVNISKRSNHSMVVGYTYWGLDATINDGGSKDLELTNDFDFPIYIEASVGGGYVTYTIWGKETRPSNRKLKFYGVTLSEEYLPDEVTIDPNMAPGTENVVQATSYPKATAQAYKEVWVGGVLEEKILLHTDKYIASARKVVRGPDAPAEDPNATASDPNAPAAPSDTAPSDTAPAAPSSETPAPTAAPEGQSAQ